jgi:hypothetical protein
MASMADYPGRTPEQVDREVDRLIEVEANKRMSHGAMPLSQRYSELLEKFTRLSVELADTDRAVARLNDRISKMEQRDSERIAQLADHARHIEELRGWTNSSKREPLGPEWEILRDDEFSAPIGRAPIITEVNPPRRGVVEGQPDEAAMRRVGGLRVGKDRDLRDRAIIFGAERRIRAVLADMAESVTSTAADRIISALKGELPD